MKKAILTIFILLFTITNVDAATFSEYLVSRANDINIESYESGEKTEMYTFEHDPTVQVPTISIDYRYIGDSPNNYVYFNCEDDNDTDTCEIWRIIGVFEVEDETGKIEQRVKLIKENSLESTMQWDSSGVNDWSIASLNAYLNKGEYYNRLSDTAKSMIGQSKYYLGASTASGQSGPTYYSFERGTEIYDSTKSTSWIGDIGLMYPSDYAYTYALEVNDKCYTNTYNCDKGNPNAGWIYNGNVDETGTSMLAQWTLSPSSSNLSNAFIIGSANPGRLYYSGCTITHFHGVRPVVYLTSNIYIVDGDGSESNPYQLSLTEKIEDGEDNNQDNNPTENPSTGINNPYILSFVICSTSVISIIIARKKKFI